MSFDMITIYKEDAYFLKLILRHFWYDDDL